VTSKGKQDLDEYIFTRPEMSKLLGISTNALRCRMRKGRCDLEYRFDGKKFMFKRPRADRLPGPLKSTPKLPLETSHDKTLREYDRRVQKRYQRGGDQLMLITEESQVEKGSTLNKVSNTITN
tara:strand:- start:415 stop:783 length:369 start_codon:yes stop_codon:yes gene_type:complete